MPLVSLKKKEGFLYPGNRPCSLLHWSLQGAGVEQSLPLLYLCQDPRHLGIFVKQWVPGPTSEWPQSARLIFPWEAL